MIFSQIRARGGEILVEKGHFGGVFWVGFGQFPTTFSAILGSQQISEISNLQNPESSNLQKSLLVNSVNFKCKK